MSDSVRPHRQQPTRLPCLWDSPGKNTGVGCHFLLQCMKVKSESEVAQSCPTLSDPMDCSLPGSSVHGIFQARVLEWGAIAFSIWTSAAKLLQSCPTLCDPIDGSPQGSSRRFWDSPGKSTGVGCHFLLQCMKVKFLSRARLLATPWTAAYQAPPSMGFSRHQYWSGVPLPSPKNLSNLFNYWYPKQ